jgi:glutathione synthase/RimK-type ligase-like ATP-grasp enzyme
MVVRPLVAYLGCPTTLPGSPTRREDAFEHDLMVGMLGMGLHYAGRALEAVSWDAADVEWSRYEAVVIGTAWDYTARIDAFVSAIKKISAQTRVLNPPATVVWNARKTYLQDLAAQNCPTIPTLWLATPDEHACRAAFATFGTDQIVIKPQVGAGAWRQVKLGAREPWPSAENLPHGATMVQPFLKNVASEGEYSLLFFNRAFSHAVLKQAAAGDYRIQSSYGGRDMPFVPTASDITQAASVLAAVPGDLLYARVDMVRGDDGALKLIELELIEPYLYPVHAPDMGHAFARAYLAIISS